MARATASLSWLRVFISAALLVGLGNRAEAWDLIHRCHGNCGTCESETVQVPGQQIVVERTAPRVVVRDVRPVRTSALVAPPVIASFFVPMPLALGTPAVPEPHSISHTETVTLDFSALEAAHELDLAQARVRALQAIGQAQADHLSAVMERAASMARQTAAPKASPSCCDDLNKQLQNLSQRVAQLEELVKYHDRALLKDGVKVPTK